MTDTNQSVADADMLRRKALDFRTRVLAGETLTEDEQREALACIRQFRKAAVEAGSKRRAASSQPTRSAGELLSLFGAKQDKIPGQ